MDYWWNQTKSYLMVTIKLQACLYSGVVAVSVAAKMASRCPLPNSGMYVPAYMFVSCWTEQKHTYIWKWVSSVHWAQLQQSSPSTRGRYTWETLPLPALFCLLTQGSCYDHSDHSDHSEAEVSTDLLIFFFRRVAHAASTTLTPSNLDCLAGFHYNSYFTHRCKQRKGFYFRFHRKWNCWRQCNVCNTKWS